MHRQQHMQRAQPRAQTVSKHTSLQQQQQRSFSSISQPAAMKQPGGRKKEKAAHMFLVPSEQQPAPEAAGADEHQHNDEQQQQPTQKKRSKSRGSNPWSSSTGWKSVDIGDELILGADEFGFAGLEVLDASLIDPAILASLDAAALQEQHQQQPSDKKARKQKDKQQQQSSSSKKRKLTGAASAATADGGAGDDDVHSLKARLQQLEAENRALKKQRKQPPAAAAAAEGGDAAEGAVDSEAAAAAAAKKQQRKLAKKQQRLERLRQRREQQKQQKRELAKQQNDADGSSDAALAPVPDLDMSAWERFDLNPDLVTALARVGFSAPTPIQDAILEPAIRDRRDVIGAAQTGSGKTLAFGLPILQVLLQEREQQQLAQQLQQDLADGHNITTAADAGADAGQQQQKWQSRKHGESPLRALILTPTRELALQVCEHLQALGKQVGVRVVALVGGIAPVKQERLLRACPPVVVATPGRLWDLITHGQQHLSHMDHLSFFVLDEADRMVQQGHYQELSSILELLPTSERFAAIAASAEAEAAAAAEAAETAAAVDEAERAKQQQQQGQGKSAGSKKGLPGKQQQSSQQEQEQQQQEEEEQDEKAADGSEGGEESLSGADSETLSDDADMGSDEELGSDSGSGEEDAAAAGDASSDEEGDGSQQQQQQHKHKDRKAKQLLQQQQRGKGHRQQQQQGDGSSKKALPIKHHLLQTFVFSATLALPAQLHKRLRKGGGGSSGAASLESLMDRICFRPRPAIVDLSPSTRLAERISEAVVQALEGERDALLYYLLARHPGRALVFVNAVSAVRRVSALLQLLGLPATALHAQQQQRQRLKALDRFKASPHGVLVATDVAARGLDVPGVQMVVHYQLPASADTYIHRSGRTARTGSNDGVSLALVTPGDAARWSALRHALEGQPNPPTFPVDDRVLLMAKQRVALAAKIDSVQRKDRKRHAESSWARSNAEALGIELSDDEGYEGLADLQHSAVKASLTAAAGGKGGKKGKKRKQDALGAAAAGLDVDSQAGQAGVAGARNLAQALSGLQRQLAGMLAVPLQPSISTKYFTGGASRAAAAAAASHAAAFTSAAAAGENSEAAADAGGVAEGELKPQSVLPAQTIAETMQLASRLQHSMTGQVAAAGGSGSSLAGVPRGRKAGAAGGAAAGSGTAAAGAGSAAAATRDDGSKARRRAAAEAAAVAARGGVLLPQKNKKKKGGKNQLQALGGVGKPTGLARLLMSNNEKKRMKKQQGMFVVRSGAAAFGRDVQGASALDVLSAAGAERQ